MSSHMEISSIRGLPELGLIEDPNFLHHWNNHLNSIDTNNLTASAFGDALQKHFLSSNPNFNTKTCMETSPTGSERPMKQLKNNSWNYNNSPQTSETQYANSCSNNLLSFADSNYENQLGLLKPKSEMVCPKIDNNSTLANMFGNQNHVFKAFQETKDIETRPNKLSQAHDHIVAERKRREKLSQRFIALSALVPNLKKMDKASVLGEAIRYLKQMEEKVNVLEEEKKRKKSVESVVIVKKSQLSYNDVEDSSSDNTTFDETLPEIEARFCERSVLIRLHCLKSQGVIEKTISEIEKLHLKVINSSSLTFGNFTLDITIIAQMDVGFCMTLKDLVRKLRSAYSSFM
ncbi:hypothetical protein P8452_11457 [Trifolium repens]|nr:transcription factor bHLH25 [Trifolium repens]WJX22120.1 hypothetical protein P8452_11457 [Trifolium repens]